MTAEKYRGILATLAPQALIPFILAIIDHESGGKPGAIAHLPTRYSIALPGRNNDPKTWDRALGLMQTIPATIENYNNAHPGAIACWQDMIGASGQAIRRQVQVGIWALIRNIEQVQRFRKTDSITRDILALALCSYAVGIGAVSGALRELVAAGIAPTYDNLKAGFPELGGPKNHPHRYVQAVFRLAEKYGSKPIQTIGGIASIALCAFLIWKAGRIKRDERKEKKRRS